MTLTRESDLPPEAERWAQMFHDAYELAAPLFGYETREASRKPWADVPEANRALMTAVAGHVGAHIARQARAEQAAEVERLRAALAVIEDNLRLREDGSTPTGESIAQSWIVAIDALTPVAPAPAETRP